MTELAKLARSKLLLLLHKARAPHIGSSLSMIDILDAVIFRSLIRKNELSINDNLVVSKGHAAAGLYSVLYAHQQITNSQLDSFYVDGSDFYGHVSHKATSWVSLTTGSLGHGLPYSIGMAIADRELGNTLSESVVVMSDGECDEGSVWESALIASHHKLNNLIVIIDRNRLQSIKTTEETLALEPLDVKWRSFGWKVKVIDGHSFEDLIQTLSEEKSAPLCIIANTIKGKGISFMENQIVWHYRFPNDKELEAARAELKTI